MPFVTRQQGRKVELLVLQHPAGLKQVPAGTVEWGETPERAALRQAGQESGLEDLRFIRALGLVEQALADPQRAVLRTTKVFDAPASDASSAGHGLRRGTLVVVTSYVDKFAGIVHEERNPYWEPPNIHKTVSGYVRTSLLSDRIHWHLFHLSAAGATQAKWRTAVDEYAYDWCWVPLEPRPELHPLQQSWLDRVYPSLLASAAMNP